MYYKKTNKVFYKGIILIMRQLLNIFFLILAAALWAGAAAAAAESTGAVLFDQGHNQRFVIEDAGELQLSKFADIIRSIGGIASSTTAPLSDELLKGVTALIISGPFEALKSGEIEAVIRFLERGGRLAAMLHIGPPLAPLLSRLDVDHSNLVLHERRNVIDSDINFRVTDLTASPLFDGLQRFSLYGAWGLNGGKSGISLARTSPDTWVDMDGNGVISKGDIVGAFDVVVTGSAGTGKFVIFGDDAIFQNRYLDEDNSRLAGNLAGWLLGR